MFIKSLRISFVGLIVFAASAWAAPSALEGIVKDPAGQPLKGADVRVEAKGGSNFSKTVKTDVKGQYVCNVLTAGNYRVTLLVNGAVKASIPPSFPWLASKRPSRIAGPTNRLPPGC